jgi:hypothetical protein
MKSIHVKAGATIDELVPEPPLAGPKQGAILGRPPVQDELYHTGVRGTVPIGGQNSVSGTASNVRRSIADSIVAILSNNPLFSWRACELRGGAPVVHRLASCKV